MAACTSRPAASIFRLRSNCRTMLVEPSWLVEVIWFTPAMRPNCRSSGVATADAMVSGLAPGRPAETEMTGNSTCGSGATGRKLKANTPESSSAAASSEVPTGRLINGAEIFMTSVSGGLGSRFLHRVADFVARESLCQPVKPQVHDWGCIESEQLAYEQSSDNRDSERMTQFGAGAAAKGERQSGEQGGHGGHHDWAETKQTRLVDGFFRRFVFDTLGLEREVNHHDGVFLHNADQQDDADERDDAEIIDGKQQRENCSHSGRGQRGQNRDGMNVALIEHSQHDVNGDDRGQNEPGLTRKRIVKSSRGSLETGIDAARQIDFLFRLRDRRGGLAQGDAGGKIEGQVHHRKLAEVIECERCVAQLKASEGRKRNLRGVAGCGGGRCACARRAGGGGRARRCARGRCAGARWAVR